MAHSALAAAAVGARRRAALLTTARSPIASARRARRRHTHAHSPFASHAALTLSNPYSHLATYLDIINNIIVQHELVR